MGCIKNEKEMTYKGAMEVLLWTGYWLMSLGVISPFRGVHPKTVFTLIYYDKRQTIWQLHSDFDHSLESPEVRMEFANLW